VPCDSEDLILIGDSRDLILTGDSQDLILTGNSQDLILRSARRARLEGWAQARERCHHSAGATPRDRDGRFAPSSG
jgi:hypothetical protein